MIFFVKCAIATGEVVGFIRFRVLKHVINTLHQHRYLNSRIDFFVMIIFSHAGAGGRLATMNAALLSGGYPYRQSAIVKLLNFDELYVSCWIFESEQIP